MTTTLDDAHRQKITRWIDEGLKLSDIQKRIDTELGLRLTYMEVRLLVDDLRLTPKDVERPKTPTLPASPAGVPSAAPGAHAPEPASTPSQPPAPEPAGTPGGVRLTVDQITRPGAVVSGTVRFSDGKSAVWYLDQMGRLGVAPEEKGYKPSAADVQAFQIELQNELARMGF